MKRNSFFRISALVILALVAVISLNACSPETDIGMVDDLTEDFLDMLLADNFDGAYDLIKDSVTHEEFKPYWDSMRTTVEGATDYELKQIGWNVGIQNGAEYSVAAFEVKLNNGRTLFFRTTLLEGYEGIAGVFFNDTTEFSATAGAYTPIINIVLIVFTLLVIAFTIWMLVDCIRRKVSKKPLWIILILLGISLSVTIGHNFALNFGIGIFVMPSSAVADPSILSVTAKLIIPLGAIIYFFLRKRLTVVPAPEESDEKVEVIEYTNSAETPEGTESVENTETANTAENSESTENTEN